MRKGTMEQASEEMSFPWQVLTDGGKGVVAGLVATLPMSAAMLLLHQLLPSAQRLPLPPAQITARSGQKAGAEMDEQELQATTVLAHFGYGAGVGSVYGVLARYLPLPPVISGVLYGLFVWFTSYMGWLPAVGLMEPATEQTRGRNIMLVVSHIVWGATVGWAREDWLGSGAERGDGSGRAEPAGGALSRWS